MYLLKNQYEFSYLCVKGTDKNYNEDKIVYPGDNEALLQKKGLLFILCDGLGGHPHGEVASNLVATELFCEYYDSVTSNCSNLVNEIENINRRLYQSTENKTTYLKMGTTLVALLIKDGRVYIGSVGDSRAYFFKGSLTQLTEDDSLVWGYYKSGIITKDEMLSHKNRNIVTQAIGIQDNINVNCISREFPVESSILICSDGLSDYVCDAEMEMILQQSVNIEHKANLLYQKAILSRSTDDISIILIERKK